MSKNCPGIPDTAPYKCFINILKEAWSEPLVTFGVRLFNYNEKWSESGLVFEPCCESKVLSLLIFGIVNQNLTGQSGIKIL